jgi:hypothetical protein
MPRLPYLLRPSVAVKRAAVRRGLLGSSNFWKLVTVVVFGRGMLRKFLGKQPDLLGSRRIGVGHVITVSVAEPLSRRERKRLGVTTASARAKARAEVGAAQRVS